MLGGDVHNVIERGAAYPRAAFVTLQIQVKREYLNVLIDVANLLIGKASGRVMSGRTLKNGNVKSAHFCHQERKSCKSISRRGSTVQTALWKATVARFYKPVPGPVGFV